MRLGMLKLFATPHKHYNFPLLYPTLARVRFKGLNFIVLEAIAKNRQFAQSAIYVAKNSHRTAALAKAWLSLLFLFRMACHFNKF
jgi:hypothetical protein